MYERRKEERRRMRITCVCVLEGGGGVGKQRKRVENECDVLRFMLDTGDLTTSLAPTTRGGPSRGRAVFFHPRSYTSTHQHRLMHLSKQDTLYIHADTYPHFSNKAHTRYQ